MEEQILKLLTANNYPLGEVDDDIQCAKEITAHVLYFLKWFCHNDIIYYEFDKPTQQLDYFLFGEISTINNIYEYWLNNVKK